MSLFMLGDQNRALEGWGGLVRLFGLPGVLLLIDGDHVKKTILTRRTPLPAKMKNRKWRFWQFCDKKNLKFEIVAEICDRECCRNFWQHGGGPLHQKCPETRIHEILCIILRVIDI